MEKVYKISVLLHILGFSLWYGGMLFISLILLPFIKTKSDYPDILEKIAKRYSNITWFFIFPLMLVTGFINAYARTGTINPLLWSEYTNGKYIVLKLHLFFLIIILSAIHDFWLGPKAVKLMREGKKENMRKISGIIGRINFILATLMLIFGISTVRGCL
ncbi:hypothetical protein HRbin19_01235 [bacterium HR19]|nr:hypothetical protein HRbin19_01235 [bacterium HR19]